MRKRLWDADARERLAEEAGLKYQSALDRRAYDAAAGWEKDASKWWRRHYAAKEGRETY